MADIIVSIFVTSGIAAAILTYILRAKSNKKKKAEEAFNIVVKLCSLLQSCIRATKAYNDGEITEEQYLKEVERFHNSLNSAGTSKLSAIVSLNFPALIPQLDELSLCCYQLSGLLDKHTTSKGPKLSVELDKVSKRIQSEERNLALSVLKEGFR